MVMDEKKLPRQSQIVKFLKRAKASAPGPDGIPNAAWLASGSYGAAALHLAMRVMDGMRPPLGFNNSLGIFLPKGTADDNTLSSLKNTDNKTIAAAINYAISCAITHWADSKQNGFICG